MISVWHTKPLDSVAENTFEIKTMKFSIVAFALVAAVAADVSHLNKNYLPPVLTGFTHKQTSSYVQEIPQVSVQEVVDNSVVEDVAGKEAAQIASGQLVVEKGDYSDAIQGHTHHAVQQIHNAAVIQSHAQQAVPAFVSTEEPAAPGPEIYHSTQQQTAYYTQVSQQQEPQPQQYYTGGIVSQHHQQQQQQQVNADVPAPQQVQQPNYVEHNFAVAAPAAQQFTQQQKTGYYGQQDSSASAGVDTQYAADGGYVY